MSACTPGDECLSTGDADRIDPAEVEALYAEHESQLRLFLTGVLRNRDLVNEALQSTFAKLLESGHTARRETRKGWLFRVAFHEALLIRRRQKVIDKSVKRLANQSKDEPDTPEKAASRHEVAETIRQALSTLPEPQVQIVQMRIYEGKKFAEIADELGIPLGTVLTRMRLALAKLSKSIDETPL